MPSQAADVARHGRQRHRRKRHRRKQRGGRRRLTRETLLVELSYDGTAFSGWATQPGRRTVAGVVLEAVRAMRPDVTEVRGASRTDAGVHARAQAAAFDAEAGIPERGWALGLAAHLPDDVAVRRVARVADGFVPRFQTRGKRYVYTLLVDALRDPLLERFALREHAPVDVEAMRAEAAAALGTHDFVAFRSAADAREDTVRTLTRFDVAPDAADPRLVRLVVEGDRFMHNMVRILAGTLLDVGTGRLDRGAVARGIASKRRDALGKTASAHGLTLDRVFVDWPDSAWPAPP